MSRLSAGYLAIYYRWTWCVVSKNKKGWKSDL